MLKKVVIENYKSFNDRQVFDLTKTKSTILEETNCANDCLKGALIVGPNASGKSNVIRAIEILLELLFRDNITLTQFDSCLFSNKNNIHLEYEFKFEDDDITYLFDFDKNQTIIREVLTLNGEIILERNGLGGKIFINGKEMVMDKLFSSKVLLLKRCYFTDLFTGIEPVSKMMEFLSNSIFLDASKKQIISFNNIGHLINEISNEDLNKVNDTFKELNIGFEISKTNESKISALSNIVLKTQDPSFFFKRKNMDITLPLELESTGNQNLFSVMPAILHCLSKNSLLLIDEFSSGFHNMLEELLVKFFFTHSDKSQLIFSSHSTNLLDTKLLRPDQIYTVELDNEKGSIIHRFSDENPREAQNIEKMYLSGKFGAIPQYNNESIIKYENK